MRPIPAISEAQFGAFTSAQAIQAGWNHSALHYAVKHQRLVAMRPGVFSLPLPTDTFDGRRVEFQTRIAATLLHVPAAVASHESAAVLAGLPTIDIPTRPCVTLKDRRGGLLRGAHLHRAALAPGELITVRPAGAGKEPGSLRSTSVARMICDTARECGVDAGVVVADAALRNALVDRNALQACLVRCRGWPRLGDAKAAVALSDERAESPLESLSRLRMAQHPFPRPDLQPRLIDRSGRFLARPDFFWAEFGVVGEADGRGKYGAESPAALYREKLRQELLEQAGLIVVRWGWSELRKFEVVLTRLWEAFARGRHSTADRQWIAI